MNASNIRSLPSEGEVHGVTVENSPLRLLPAIIAMQKNGSSRNPPEISSPFKLRLLAVQQFIDDHASDVIAISDLAKRAGTTEHKLKTSFKAQFGLTVFKYQQHVRMSRAHRMLKEGENTVKEIAYESGYSNMANFTNAFKLWYGYPPTALKKQAIHKS